MCSPCSWRFRAVALGATPIPQVPAELAGLELFSGTTATPHAVKAPNPPRHPFMAPNGRSNVHNDAYQTDTYRYAGPLGRDMRSYSQAFGGIGSCGITIVFDKQGRLLTTCISATTGQPAPDGPGHARHGRGASAPAARDPARREPLPDARRRLLLPR